jgi:hypothetical protein
MSNPRNPTSALSPSLRRTRLRFPKTFADQSLSGVARAGIARLERLQRMLLGPLAILWALQPRLSSGRAFGALFVSIRVHSWSFVVGPKSVTICVHLWFNPLRGTGAAGTG